ncbi:MAG TPA: hypothetical protein VF081_00655 [Solirubrobacterales bacterium]
MPVMLERWNDDKMDALDAKVDGLTLELREQGRDMKAGFERVDDRFERLYARVDRRRGGSRHCCHRRRSGDRRRPDQYASPLGQLAEPISATCDAFGLRFVWRSVSLVFGSAGVRVVAIVWSVGSMIWLIV